MFLFEIYLGYSRPLYFYINIRINSICMHMHIHTHFGRNFIPFLFFIFVSENIPSPKKFKLSFCASSVNPRGFSCMLKHHHLILAPLVFYCPLTCSPQQINTAKCLLFPAKANKQAKTNVFQPYLSPSYCTLSFIF